MLLEFNSLIKIVKYNNFYLLGTIKKSFIYLISNLNNLTAEEKLKK